MTEFPAEGLCRPADAMSLYALEAAAATGQLLQSTALAFDNERRLRFTLAGLPGLMPFDECADGAAEGLVRDVAVLTRVGKPTCFVVLGLRRDEQDRPYLALSRAKAQRRCRQEYLDRLRPGQVISCTVTHLEPFGAFCDVGCGVSALLPIDCLSVSRIGSPADRVRVGQQLLCAVKNRDEQGRLVLTLRELMGTWQENADCFHPGETVVGIVRSVEEYGVFIEIAPNLAGLAEHCDGLEPGQGVSVYIKSILPEKMKIKLVVVNRNLHSVIRFEPRYFVREGIIRHWVYSTPGSRKQVETVFGEPAAAL